KWLRHPAQKGWREAERPTHRSVLSLIRPAYSRQLPVANSSLTLELGNSLSTAPAGAGRENANGWTGGRRRRTSLRPGCNGLDMVKVRQGKPTKRRANGRKEEGR